MGFSTFHIPLDNNAVFAQAYDLRFQVPVVAANGKGVFDLYYMQSVPLKENS